MTSRASLSRAGTPDLYKALGARIKEQRVIANLSQRALAECIGTNRPSLTLIEAGQQRCALHELLAIADVLHVPVCDLLAGLEAERCSMPKNERRTKR